MPRVYQLPQLYVRGSMYSQTGRNLTDDQQDRISRLISQILKHPNIGPVRRKLLRNLRPTIGCEFAEGPEAIDAELGFIAWKAALWLYHMNYDFECEHCVARSYRSTTGRIQKINQQFRICPACDHVRCNGQYVHKDQAADLPYESPIRAIGTTRKCTPEQADALMSDPTQFIKLVSRFASGHIQQILRENKIPYARTEYQLTSTADALAIQELQGLFDTYNIKNWPSSSWGSQHSEITTSTSLLLAPPAFSVALKDICCRYEAAGVHFIIDSHSITIAHDGAPQVMTTTITKWNPVLVVADSESIGPGGEDASAAQRGYSLESNAMVPAAQHIETNELVSAIRSSLFDQNATAVYDIITEGHAVPPGENNSWNRFAEVYDTTRGHTARNKQLADVLGITVKQVEAARNHIKVHMLAHQVNISDRAPDVDYDTGHNQNF